MNNERLKQKGVALIKSWREDWCKFAREALGVYLDKEQEDILASVQHNKLTSVASGTARGKDFVAAVASLAFLYLTPRWNEAGEMVANTKVALTAPTDRQVKNIMMPEIARLYNRAKKKGIYVGRINAYDIRTDNVEWFLTGFKADEYNHEAWSGFHAVNTMFAVTEASGMSDSVFDALEGNLQGNSRLLLVFNPNRSIGYAAKSQKDDRWHKFRLNSLTAPNVTAKKIMIPGQVDYEWVQDKIKNWCVRITESDQSKEHDDFEFEGQWYRPEDLFRIKVLGKFPKIPEGVLVPYQWIEEAQGRWLNPPQEQNKEPLILGVDVAGMGRDSTVYCYRYGARVERLEIYHSGGKAEHMAIAGKIKSLLSNHPQAIASVDTIGEGAGVYSRLVEQGLGERTISCKYSNRAVDDISNDLHDLTGQYTFANMRAYLFWAVRDWLNPKNNTGAMLPPGDSLSEEVSEVKWRFRSDGRIIIEPKEDIKKRLGRSTDALDALANTFYPIDRTPKRNLSGLFF